jgi:hypothetical protein
VHLGELVKISISYVRELKKATSLAKTKLNVNHLSAVNSSKRAYSFSINNQPNNKPLLDLPYARSLSQFPDEKNTQQDVHKTLGAKIEEKEPTDKPLEAKKHIGWLSTISIAKTVTSHLNVDRKAKKDYAKANENVKSEHIGEDTKWDENQLSHLEGDELEVVNNNLQTHTFSKLNTHEEETKIKPFSAYSILTNDYLFSKRNQQRLLRMQENYIRVRNTSKVCYDMVTTNAKKLNKLIRKDSYQFVRQAMSLLLVVLGFFYFFVSIIVAFFRERKVYETFFNFFYDNIEINNPQTSAFPN